MAAGRRPLVQRRRVTYRVDVPFHLVLRLDFLDAGATNAIGFFLQPETDDFEGRVVEDDVAFQQAYDLRALPLEVTAEVRTRADRATVELPQMLGDLVVAAGSRR